MTLSLGRIWSGLVGSGRLWSRVQSGQCVRSQWATGPQSQRSQSSTVHHLLDTSGPCRCHTAVPGCWVLGFWTM